MSDVNHGSITVLASLDRVWFDSQSLISYLREVELWAIANECDDAAAVVQRVADGLVLTSLVASDEIRSRRGTR